MNWPCLSLQPHLGHLDPGPLDSSPVGLLDVSQRFRAFAFVVPPAWKVLPPPLHMTGFSSSSRLDCLFPSFTRV